jgi:hypothetical protein
MSSPKTISDEETIKLAQKKVKGTDEEIESKSSKFKKSIAHLIIDFNILPYIVSFTIAIAFSDFMKSISNLIIKYFNLNNEIFVDFLTLLLILFFTYIFGYLFFYKYIYTKDIAKENIIKNAITEEKEKEIKKTIKKDLETKQEIKKTAKINNVEGFQF